MKRSRHRRETASAGAGARPATQRAERLKAREGARRGRKQRGDRVRGGGHCRGGGSGGSGGDSRPTRGAELPRSGACGPARARPPNAGTLGNEPDAGKSSRGTCSGSDLKKRKRSEAVEPGLWAVLVSAERTRRAVQGLWAAAVVLERGAGRRIVAVHSPSPSTGGSCSRRKVVVRPWLVRDAARASASGDELAGDAPMKRRQQCSRWCQPRRARRIDEDGSRTITCERPSATRNCGPRLTGEVWESTITAESNVTGAAPTRSPRQGRVAARRGTA